MAIEQYERDSAGAVVVDGTAVHIIQNLVLETPKAALYLSGVPDGHRVAALEDLLDQGASTLSMVRASAHVVILERRVEDLTSSLAEALEQQLRRAGTNHGAVTKKLLDEHREQIGRLLVPLTDPNLKNGLPTKIVELLELSHRRAETALLAILQDGDDGVLAQAVRRIVAQVKESEAELAKQFAAREALLTRSNLRGARFEDVLAARLPSLARAIGRVEHCALTSGSQDANAGDYLITIETGLGAQDVHIVVEAKAHKARLSANEIRKQLRRGRLNRGAAAGVLVTFGTGTLPDGIGFGQVSNCDFYAALDADTGDETALSCALFMARAAALASMPVESEVGVDRAVLEHEIGLLRGLMQQFASIEASHSRAEKAIGMAKTSVDALRADIVAALHRIEAAIRG